MHAPEFPPNLPWLNASPLTMESLRGKVVLIDFWTYSCINCQRTQPHLNAWHERYKDKGLVIIGVHTPEFEFEKQRENVERAVVEAKVTYPVVLDSDYVIWNLYANHWWPRKFLVNGEGKIVYDHVGEGGYAETEKKIQEALGEIGVEGLPEVTDEEAAGGGICYQSTPETYLGFLRGHYGHWVAENEVDTYKDLGKHKKDTPYLSGAWIVRGEGVQQARKSAEYEDYLLLPYRSFSLNAVLHTAGEPTEVLVTIDGEPLSEANAGADIHFVDGRSFVTVSAPRMYRLVNAKEFHQAELRLYSKDGLAQIFAFTFGGCET